MDGMTTHRRDYKGAPGSRGHPCKPDNQAYQSHAPLDDETNYVHDYRPWPTSRPYHHRPDEYQEPQGEFQDSTTHKTAFKELPLVKSIRKKPESANRNNNAPFEGRTNYYDDFQPKQGDRALIPRQTEYKPSSAPFGGDSTYKKHYVPHSQQPSQSCRPDNKPQQSDERFAGDTMYKTDYTPKYADICPTIPIIRGHSNKYQFIELSSAGHKMYEPIYTTISPLQSRDRRLSNQRLAMSYA